jgi:uncharacterized protein YdiU (UPF0061 family)
MRCHNPTVILRNWMAQVAIDRAEQGDFSYTRALQEMLQTPYAAQLSSFQHNPLSNNLQQQQEQSCSLPASSPRELFLKLPPGWADGLLCTCSS